MGIQLKLILIAYFVSSGGTLVQLHNPNADQARSNADNAGRLQENIQNILNSASKNNVERSEAYQRIVKQEIAKEQQIFNKMKEELWIAQNRNTDKNKKSYKRINVYKDNIVAKREIDEQKPVTSVQSFDKLSQSSEKSTELPLSSDGQSTESTKPTSPQPTAQTCVDMKTAILSYDMKSFVKVVNIAYKKLFRHPQTNQIAHDVLNHLLVSCRTHTRIKEVVRRPDPKSNYTQAAGTLDIRSVDQKGGNLVIKLKFNQNSCMSLSQLLNCSDEKSFKELYPGEKVTLLCLNFNKDREAPVIGEWIALFVKDGEIIGKGQQHQATCLKTEEYKDLKYRDKLVVEYFENLD